MYKEINDTMQIVWSKKLLTLCQKIYKEVERKTAIKLQEPLLGIFPGNKTLLGSWDPKKRLIKISADLFLHYEKSAVEYVLRHEIAHQFVDEIFKKREKPHGDAFKEACKILEIKPKANLTKEDLTEFASDKDKAIVGKIKKILAKGHCESASEKEAEMFLKKAQELIIKHNLSQRGFENSENVFITRPVGKFLKKTPGYYWDIFTILRKYYFVKAVRCSVFVKKENAFDLNIGSYQYYFNLFGEPSNLDIAEYIFEALLHQGEYLWNEFKKEKRKHNIPIKGNYSKKAFLEGVYEGYDKKLSEEKETIVKESDERVSSLIRTEDPLLTKAYHKEFPKLSKVSLNYSSMQGYNAGVSKGKQMRISPGVTSKSDRGKLLK